MVRRKRRGDDVPVEGAVDRRAIADAGLNLWGGVLSLLSSFAAVSGAASSLVSC
ncbi:MAG: hypothetical protein JWR32_6625 [Mycobacterium sp.]|jgi:hypothetical protein|nr:hypothetical protein [Mycobacterium sp.]